MLSSTAYNTRRPETVGRTGFEPVIFTLKG